MKKRILKQKDVIMMIDLLTNFAEELKLEPNIYQPIIELVIQEYIKEYYK